MARVRFSMDDSGTRGAVRQMMAGAGVDSLSKVAKLLDMKETTFRNAVRNDTLRAHDLRRAAKALGYEIEFSPFGSVD